MTSKTLRGQLLDFLYKVYPEEAEEITIISVFYQYFKESQIRKSLQYLVDKGYVSGKDIPHPVHIRRMVRLYKILPAGVDLIEGNIQDETILFEEE
jgi:DNA-binding PadR family transcriptional regulator